MAGDNKKEIKEKSKGTFVLGLVIIILAVTGLGFLINSGIGEIKKHTNNSSEKAEYEKLLYPVIMLDPDTFDDITGADMEDLICSSILSVITDEENNPYNYEFVEGDVSGLGISSETVEKAFRKLYGTEVTPVHQSVECSTCIFEYQPAAKRYVIPITGYDPAYTPRVFQINKTKEGNVEVLTGYIAYGDIEKNENGEISEPEPAKYRKITLRKDKTGYYVSSIQNADSSQIK